MIKKKTEKMRLAFLGILSFLGTGAVLDASANVDELMKASQIVSHQMDKAAKVRRIGEVKRPVLVYPKDREISPYCSTAYCESLRVPFPEDGEICLPPYKKWKKGRCLPEGQAIPIPIRNSQGFYSPLISMKQQKNSKSKNILVALDCESQVCKFGKDTVNAVAELVEKHYIDKKDYSEEAIHKYGGTRTLEEHNKQKH